MCDLGTKEECLELLKASQSAQDWNEACDSIKSANCGYPSWWYAEVIQSGLADEIMVTWDGDASIRVSVI